MPNYLNTDKNRLIEPHEVQRMLTLCDNARDKAIIALLYVSGCRPVEALRLQRKDFDLVINEDGDKQEFVTMTIYTAKQQRVKTFNQPYRRMKLYLDYPFIEYLLDYVALINEPDRLLFPFSRQKLHSLVFKKSGRQLTPYNFRHNRAYRLFQSGAQDPELMTWFGHTDKRSISPYAGGKPILRKLVVK